LPFHVVELDEEWEDIYNTVSEVVDFNKLFEDDYYGIYEIITVEVDDIYPTMTWSFPCEYKEDQIIKFVFCSMDLITIEVCNGTLNEDGSILVNTEYVEPNSYYMIVLASDTFDI